MNTNSKIKLNMDALKSAKEWVRHKVKPGNNIYRILPPFGDASNGYPYRKWQIIWGLQDPANGRMRPYASPMMTEKRCPMMEFVKELQDRLAKIDGELKQRGMDEKAVKKHPKYARLAKFIRDITPKTTYIYNAADKSGVVGLLELKSSAHKDMKTAMNQYIQDYNQDPTSLNSDPDDSGVWFNVKREGDGFDTEYKVEKVQVKTKGPTGISFQDDRSPLPEALVENFQNLAYDLSSVYKMTSYDEVKEVLDANLERFYEMCPEADTSKSVDLDSEDEDAAPTTVVRQNPTPQSKPAGKVALKLQDEDDEDVAPAKPAGKVSKAAPLPWDDTDDFMKAADEILKG